jgi:hypothetical protein
MNARRRLSPSSEALESRTAPVGFSDGPFPVPIQVFVQGSAQGFATPRPATTGRHAHHVAAVDATIRITATGLITPLGKASVSGTIQSKGPAEVGTLTIQSNRSNLTLRLVGTAGPSSALFSFNIVNGRATVPGNFAYAREQGSGTVEITPAPGSGSTPIALAFHL